MTVTRFCERTPARTDWETPIEIFGPLNAEFNFQLDVCATEENTKCARYFTSEQDGVSQKWSGMCWMNPPYGRNAGRWVQKAYDSACKGDCTVVCLLPVRSDNEWWKLIIQAEVRFIRGRVYFVGGGRPIFPSIVAIFHAHLDPGGIMKVWKP